MFTLPGADNISWVLYILVNRDGNVSGYRNLESAARAYRKCNRSAHAVAIESISYDSDKVDSAA